MSDKQHPHSKQKMPLWLLLLWLAFLLFIVTYVIISL